MNPRDFQSCVDDYYTDLYRFAYSLAKNESDACDITQQTFVILAQKGGEIREVPKRKSWLFTTLYREFLKTNSRAQRLVSVEEADLESFSDPAPADALQKAEQHEILDALAAMDDGPRAILSLFYIDQCSYKEIAVILDLPIGTVMSRLSRAKEMLRQRWHDGCSKPE